MIETVTNEHAVAMLRAVVAMGVLSLAMFVWMYATRLPAMRGMDPQKAAHTRDLATMLPSGARAAGDNYNHLFEAPTIFYALVFAIVLLGQADGLHATCAWAYVALRAVHSLVQATFNRVILRFALFSLSWVALGVMIVRAAVTAFA